MRPRAPSVARVAFSLLTCVVITCQQPAGSAAQRARAAGAARRAQGMALVRGGRFRMGTAAAEVARLQEVYGIKRADLFAGELPRHDVTVSSFYLDRHEVTNAQFKQFVESHPRWRRARIHANLHNGNYLKHWTGDEYPAGQSDHPVTNVSWYAAVAFCQAVGKRLPTEAEWEYAARGGAAGGEFPWGDAPADKSRANYHASGIGGTTRVGSYPPNVYGLYDLAGNVWEYLADEWGAYPSAAQVNPVAGGNLFLDETYLKVTTRRVLRGGSWGGAPVNLRVAYRDSHPPEGAQPFVGFRCAKTAPAPRRR